MSDTPAIEPLPPALEEAARSIAHEWMKRLGYAPGIPAMAQRWLDAGEHEDFDAVYDLKKTLRFVRFVLERVPRDPAAELVEAVAKYIAAVEAHEAYLERTTEVRDAAEADAAVARIGQWWGAMKAALARVKEQP